MNITTAISLLGNISTLPPSKKLTDQNEINFDSCGCMLAEDAIKYKHTNKVALKSTPLKKEILYDGCGAILA